MTIRPIHRLGRKLLFGSGTLTGLLLGWTGAGALEAQTPMPGGSGSQKVAAPESAPVQRNYLNKSVIQLPIQISESSRSLITEIQLYVKDHPGAAWAMRDKVGPAATAFTFKVPQDGEYWFTMVTMDKQGRGFPSDLRNEPPGLVVMIDTQTPQIDLTNMGSSSEGQLIQFEARDANLDSSRTKLTYQGGDRMFRPLDPVAGRPNVFRIPAQAVSTGVIRAMAEDLAGNQALREITLDKLAAASAPAAAPPMLDVKRAIEKSSISTTPKTLPRGIESGPEIMPMETSRGQRPTSASMRPDGSEGPRLIEHTSESSPISTPAAPPFEQDTLKRQFVNSSKVFLDYQIENAGQSGVGKVEVWITRDRAKHWQKISEETKQKGPAEIQFPGDGLFGVTLVACNGRGVAGASPAAGEAPDWWIEVDTSKPTAQLTKIYSATENGKSVVHIGWSAQDNNLGDTPIDLFYSATPQGPWLPIAKGLKAEGQHRWVPPIEIGAQAHLRLVAKDAAGNTAIVASQEPVQFDDVVRPRAVIRGVTTGASDSAPVAAPSVSQPPAPLPLPTPVQIVQPPTTK